MASANRFKNASVYRSGQRRGVDEAGHLTFGVRTAHGEEFYGEYFEVWTPENEFEFNIEVGAFGFPNPEDAGLPDPGARESFSAEEIATLEKLLPEFLSNPNEMMKVWKHTGLIATLRASNPSEPFRASRRTSSSW